MAILSLVEDLATWLAARSIGLYKGENLWLGDWQDRPTFATLIRETGSQSHTATVIDRDGDGHISSHFRDATFQIMTRAGRYQDAHDQQQKIYLVLHGRHHFSTTNFTVQGCEALAVPQVVSGSSSAKDPWHIVTNYALLVRDDSAL